ncbi:hypothetical protein COEREDRAFT_12361, partial [Coemansia reversa NRRL 1564]
GTDSVPVIKAIRIRKEGLNERQLAPHKCTASKTRGGKRSGRLCLPIYILPANSKTDGNNSTG